jgi:uncharacterized protein
MRFAEQAFDTKNTVQGYAVDRITISERDYCASLVVTPNRIIPDWGPVRIDQLGEAEMAALLADQPQVIIIGTGSRQRLPEPRAHSWLMSHGVGVEIMDTGAACRTYNILVGEGRRVAAGLMLDAPGD